MVSRNPFLARKWTSKLFGATVIDDIWAEMIFFTLVATMVVLVSRKTDVDLAISNQMLTVLGTVLGLVVSFRTSSAYDRYWEGRKLWTSINLASRNLAHLIWIHVPNERTDKSASTTDAKEGDAKSDMQRQSLMAVIEKKTMINLVQAFSVAVKHMLRGEPGIYYADLYPLVCYLPKYASACTHEDGDTFVLPLWDQTAQPASSLKPRLRRTVSESAAWQKDAFNGTGDAEKGTPEKKRTFDPEQVLPRVEPTEHVLAPARLPPKVTVYDYLPIFLLLKPIVAVFQYALNKLRRGRRDDAPDGAGNTSGRGGGTATRTLLGRKKRPAIVESNVPLEITLFLSTYLAWLQRNGLVQAAIATALTNNISAMQDTNANLDRIRSTPIPFAYQAHLRMTLWLYLLFLPFQILNAFGYLVIPATAFAAFLLLGFLEIGQEIEDPFGYDLNDLDIDKFCLSIERELHEITAHPAPDPESFIFGPLNQPFAPADRRSAKDLIDVSNSAYVGSSPDEGMASVRRTLLQSWKKVFEATTPSK